MLEKFLYLSDLFDIYGKLLTEKQQQCLEMSLYDDFSLSEIANELGISRQAVYDNLHRCEKIMNGYEEHLGILKHRQLREKEVAEVKDLLTTLDGNNIGKVKEQINASLDKLLK